MTETGETTMTRRVMLSSAAAGVGLAAATAARDLVNSAQAQAAAKTFVLVHGAWHGGWCWRRVSDLLEKRGHKVFSPTMTGLGERSHLIDPKINLTTHITDMVNVIKWEGLNDIVLVGHSYGGAVVSGVAERVREAIGSIIFLDAFVPENGDSLKDLTVRRAAIEELVQKGETTMKPVPAAVFQVNEKDRAWVDSKCTPQPLATFTESDHPHRRARPHREKGLYPRHGFCQCAVRRRAGEGQGKRLARLRDAVWARRHGGHAGSPD